MNDLASLLRETLGSQIFTGVAAGGAVTALMGYLLFQLRAIPAHITGLIESQFTLTLTVQNDDMDVFHPLSVWLSEHPDAQKTRRFTVVSDWVEDRSETRADVAVPVAPTQHKQRHRLTPGEGMHLIRHRGRFFLIGREMKQPGQGGEKGAPPPAFGRRAETITVRTYGRNGDVLRRFIEDVTHKDEAANDTVDLYFWQRGYERINGRLKRPLGTVFLDAGFKERVLADIRRFQARRRWYADRGIQWRRGYLLEGPPGTGKSTLIFALASELSMPVHIINPATIYGDGELMMALNRAGGGIVVIEDIDTFKVTQARPKRSRRDDRAGGVSSDACPEPAYPSLDREEEAGHITLSGLLNAIDGIASAEGRILFITSNHPDALDPALLRPGRIDRRERLDLAGMDVALAMFRAFFPEGDALEFAREMGPKLPMAPAAIQNLLLERIEAQAPESPVGALVSEIKRRIA